MKTMQINQVAEIKLSYVPRIKACDRPLITDSRSSYDVLLNHWSDQIGLLEEFYILLLDRSNRVMGMRLIASGGLSGVLIDTKMIFACALVCRASNIVLAHNHPSGNLSPSQADLRLTRRIVEAGKLLDIKVWDHLILSPEGGYYSFADEGMMPH